MLEGKRTYITLAVMAIYDVLLPLLGVTDLSRDQIGIVANATLIMAAAIFRKLAKPQY